MNHIRFALRAAALLAVLASALGLGLPSAQADDGQPPVVSPTLLNAAPAQPAGDAHAPPVGCNSVTPVLTNNTAQDIFDNTTITSTIYLTSTSHFLWNMSLNTRILHSFPADMDIHLISPHHTVVTLSNRLGLDRPGNVFSNTTWDDQAALVNGSGLPVTDYLFTPGTNAPFLNPQEPLGAFFGEDPNGPWQLVIRDNENVDEGTLEGWSLLPVILDHAPASQYTTVDSNSSPQAIPNGGSVSRYLYPAGIQAITAVTLTTVITHDRPGTLNIFLISPQGVSLTVSSGNGGLNRNVFAGTTWTDVAGKTQPPGSVTEKVFADETLASPLAPEEGFGEVTGASPLGYWQLVVQDTNSIDGASGQLGEVSLQVDNAACAPDMFTASYPLPFFPRLGAPAGIEVDALNGGAAASSVVLTASLPSPLRFLAVDQGDWLCVAPAPNTLAAVVHCSRPSLAALTISSITLTVAGLSSPASLSITSTAQAAGLDANPANNSSVWPFGVYAGSANKNPWDVKLTTGAIGDGGQDAFDHWGQLRVAVYSGGSLVADQQPAAFGLEYSPGHHWDTTSPVLVGNVLVSRNLFAPANTDWLRYLDTFTNLDPSPRQVVVVWGGALGSGSATVTGPTASGDHTLTAADRWALTLEQPGGTGPATDPVLGYALRSPADHSFLGPVSSSGPITGTWAATGNGHLGLAYSFTLPAGATAHLAYFVYRGLEEANLGPDGCGYYGGCVNPPAGSQVALAQNTVAALAAIPAFCDLPPGIVSQIVNWPGISSTCDYLPLVRR